MLHRNKIIFGLLIACSLLLLSACSDEYDLQNGTFSADENDTLAVRTVSGSVKGAFKAVQSPLVDLNIMRDEIPEPLMKISGSPYSVPSPLQCKVMKTELAELDTLLGPDMQAENDAGKKEKDKDYVAEGASMLQSHAIGMVASKASILPLRGVVRYITGASEHSKQLAQAYESGKLRRAYLKGLSMALKCDKPAKSSKKQIQLTENKAK